MSLDFAYVSATPVVQQWQELHELMDKTQTELSGCTGSAFAPGVQADAKAFIATWSGLAAESSTMAAGFADVLHHVHTTYGATDEAVQARFAQLDNRLGPAR